MPIPRSKQTFHTLRIYDDAQPGALRVLVDRLWPRGIRRDAARLDRWEKTLAPSDTLRRWFGHDPDRWPAFRDAYTRELEQNRPAADAFLDWALAQGKPVSLLYAAKDPVHHHAAVLAPWLERRLRRCKTCNPQTHRTGAA